MADTIYTTVQGDTWDLISLNQYGSELFTDKIVAANFNYRTVLVFGAGTVLTIPEVKTTEIETTDLPPWRRS